MCSLRLSRSHASRSTEPVAKRSVRAAWVGRLDKQRREIDGYSDMMEEVNLEERTFKREFVIELRSKLAFPHHRLLSPLWEDSLLQSYHVSQV